MFTTSLLEKTDMKIPLKVIIPKINNILNLSLKMPTYKKYVGISF